MGPTERRQVTVVCNGCGTTAESAMKIGNLSGLLTPTVPFVRAPRGWWATAAVWPDAETDEGATAPGPISALMFVCPGCAELGRFEGAPDTPGDPS